jgi:predicted transposase YbfD/YdcC
MSTPPRRAPCSPKSPLPGKGKELAATKEVLEHVDLAGKMVAGDALQTQRKVCEQIVAQGGEYLLPVKENHPALRADLVHAFSPTERG